MEPQNPSSDVFSGISLAPPDPILGITQAWKADKDSNKLNLGVGAYRDDNEKPYVFQAVRKALQEVVADPNLDLEYLPIDGHAGLRDTAQKLLFGAESPYVKEGKIVTVQSLSGTGALRVGFAFIKRFLEGTVYVSKPTWANHLNIISDSNLNYKEYGYLDDKGVNLNFDAVRDTISSAPAGSIVLLDVCAHNPTGVDPSVEQWRELAKIFKEKKLFPFFDCAYQGFASGSLEKDREPIEIFLKEGLQMLVAQSFAKNFGLYGERVGALHVVCSSKETVEKVMSQLKSLIRPMYSNPPAIGAKIVHKILSNKELTQQWEQELKEVSERLQKMRKLLFDELKALGVKGNWDHIVSQIGMFSYTGLNTKQCEALTEKHHVYLVKNGRISMAGVNSHNVKRLAEGIKDVVENC